MSRELFLALAIALAAGGTGTMLRAQAAEAPGTAIVTGDAAECQRATSVDLWWIGGQGRPQLRARGLRTESWSAGSTPASRQNSSVLMTLLRQSIAARMCRWRFDDLQPGTYVAALMGAHGSGGTQQFAVLSNETATVTIPPPLVTVSGRLLFNGEPLKEATLRFYRTTLTEGVSPWLSVSTDDDGRYAAALDRPGSYFVRSGTSSDFANVPGVVPLTTGGASLRMQAFLEGANTFDWSGEGTEVSVRIAGWDGATPTTILIRSGEAARAAVLRAGDPNPLRILYLPNGDHQVMAYQSGGRVSAESTSVTIDNDHPRASANLSMVENRGTLRIHDPEGQPIRGATVTVWAGGDIVPRLPESEPGVFPLAGVPAGVDLRIRPPAALVPSCRTASFNEPIDVTLAPGRATEVVFQRARIAGPTGTLSGIEGSDCPVPFGWFNFSRLAGNPVRGTIRNFPQSRSLVFDFDGLSQAVEIPNEGPVFIK